jgi:hypothetical protein
MRQINSSLGHHRNEISIAELERPLNSSSMHNIRGSSDAGDGDYAPPQPIAPEPA